MARLGIKSGYMTKRNEQAVWQRRYCVLVPHTFLYYFDTEDAEAPRGTIDLEYYTDISADAAHQIKVRAPASKPPLPSKTDRWIRILPHRLPSQVISLPLSRTLETSSQLSPSFPRRGHLSRWCATVGDGGRTGQPGLPLSAG